MRLALISDLHGNLTALEAVLADLHAQAVEDVICLGDVATIGPQPREVIARLRGLGIACVLGNHDAALLDPSRAAEYQISPLLTAALDWAVAQLTDDDRAFLRSLAPTLSRPLGPHDHLLCFHGSPAAHTDLLTAATAAEDLDRLLAPTSATVFAGGHTHVQLVRQHRGRLLLNPGSVGSPFLHPQPAGGPPSLLPWAEYACLSWTSTGLGVELRRVRYDLGVFCDAVTRSAMPLQAWWLAQYGPSRG